MKLKLYKNLHKNFKRTLRNLGLSNYNSRKKKNIIWDKTCPKCNNFIYGNIESCSCGYSATREKTIKLWSIIAFTWFFVFAFLLFMFNSFSELNSIVYKKLENNDSDFYSLAPANVQIIAGLRNSKYKNCIQNIYVNPRQKNKLMVLIKPVYWDMLPEEEKDLIKKIIMRKWSKIYRNTTPGSKYKPEVQLANFN